MIRFFDRRIGIAISLASLLMFAGIANAQVSAPPADTQAKTQAGSENLNVIDEAGEKHTVSRKEFAGLPRQTVKVKDHEADAEFEGVLLVELLKSAGVKFGDDLKGRRAATIAILDAPDKYRVALSLLDIDPQTSDRTILVADTRDGKPLDAHQGPYRLVVAGDKRAIRWIRNLHAIRVVNLNDLPIPDASKAGARAAAN